MTPQALLIVVGLIWIAAVASWWRTCIELEAVERRLLEGGGGARGGAGRG